MAYFGYFYVVSLLREMNWPRKQGILRRLKYDTTVADLAVAQMIKWAVSLGAGRPSLALQMIARIYSNRNWNGADAPDIPEMIRLAQPIWDSMPDAAPHVVIEPASLKKHFGKTISPDCLKHAEVTTGFERYCLFALIWGLVNPDRFAKWYAQSFEEYSSHAELYRIAKLNVQAPPSLDGYYEYSEQILRYYEQDVAPLPSIPAKLLSDAREMGISVPAAC